MDPPIILDALIDLSGTLHIGDSVIDGAVDAINRLQQSSIGVTFLTNTSTKSSIKLLEQLQALGFTINTPLLTSVLATKEYLIQHKLRPLCLMEDTSDFSPQVPLDAPHNAVVVGFAPTHFHYELINQAFRLLLHQPEAPLIAIHRAPYIRDSDGDLSLGPGGFVACLEHATKRQAIVMGKPNREFFATANVASWQTTVMVGDDWKQDIMGSKEAGIGHTILVKTGKYQEGDEEKCQPTFLAEHIGQAVDYILNKCRDN